MCLNALDLYSIEFINGIYNSLLSLKCLRLCRSLWWRHTIYWEKKKRKFPSINVCFSILSFAKCSMCLSLLRFLLCVWLSLFLFPFFLPIFLSLCTVMCVRLPGLILPLFQQPFYIHANTFIPSMNPFTQPDIPCRTKAHTFLFIHKIDKKTFYFDIVRMIGPFSRQTK